MLTIPQSTITNPVVAIRSPHWGRYLTLNGSGVTEHKPEGLQGNTYTQPHIQPWEEFYMEHNTDGTVSFRSKSFNNVYLSMNGQHVDSGRSHGGGAGEVRAQYGNRGSWERFHLKRTGHPHYVGIESAGFSGRFLRFDAGDGHNVVNVQGKLEQWEQFEIVVIA